MKHGNRRVTRVTNPFKALRHQNGLFEIISPYGHVFHVICQRSSRMNFRKVGLAPVQQIDSKTARWWMVKRLGRVTLTA